ncbi:uncharacterized protein VP01_1375g1 [Puccinia sorghi]|uniref:Tet-like 2OG-Fe(II) oxygenase domain-containing protein n=1 Tax=Puccinia sorghi TaxID=27349 RepID=A0A0L6VM35_9BASI|nr:uncharacterized protein VP01_2559g1 [Puccinia sorghi]KNZ61637.1 uncharacterized protein VP01_1375g1 [Puccinia sorghi]
MQQLCQASSCLATISDSSPLPLAFSHSNTNRSAMRSFHKLSDVTNDCANDYKAHHPQSQPNSPSTRSKLVAPSFWASFEPSVCNQTPQSTLKARCDRPLGSQPLLEAQAMLMEGDDKQVRKKRVRRGRAAARWSRYRDQADEPFVSSHVDSEPQESENEEEVVETIEQEDGEAIYYYFVPPKLQHDPRPEETLTSSETLKLYHRLSHGTCVIAPQKKPAFCKVKFLPFSSMSPTELQGWEKLVCFFLGRTQFVEPVKNNGPLMGGVMWADGWRKCSKRGEWFGRYCSVARLSAMIQLCLYSAEDEAASFREANDWIATHLEKLAPGVLEKYHQLLLKSQLPSFAHMEYPTPYSPLDFASFFTFTMYNFHNEDHTDKDANTWTLVCWIPIFNPLTSTETDPILADDGFDMIGGHFTFHDFQVYLDLNNVLGVTMCVFRSQDHTHQTLKGASPSDRYTRLGFSCQMSEKMSHAVVSYINTKNKARMIVSGQQVQIDNAEAKLAKRK